MGVQINGDTGNISATKADYSGNVTIGGTLTYEDVTNIDSVGLVTAREGIEVGARPGVAASISVDGNMIVSGVTTIGGNVKVGTGITISPDGDIFFTGIITGNGSGLTNAGPSLTGSTNNTVVTVTGANAMQGEANLTFDGTDFDVASGNSSIKITTSSNTPKIHFNANSVTDAGKIQLSESSGGGVMIFSTADTGGTLNEAMRISTTGQVLVGNSTQNASPFTTSTAFNVQRNNDNVASFYHAGTNFNPVLIIRHQRSGSSGNSAVNIQFNNTNGFQCGSISSTLTATSYNTSSDYRLKENAVSISDGITRLKTLKPYRFNFKVEASKTLDGFFAHEVTAVPEAISGTKDATENCSNVVLDKDGNFLEKNVTEDQWNSGKAQEPAIYPTDSTWSASYTKDVYQEIDQAKLVPLLTAALQEAITKIETLETKVAALEAA